MKNSMRGAGHRATGMRRAGDGGALLVGALLALALLLLAIDPAAAWVCVKGVNTPVDLAGRDAACLSLDGRGCRWLPSREECAAAALEAPEDAKSLVCGDMMQKLYGEFGCFRVCGGSLLGLPRVSLKRPIAVKVITC